MRPAHKTIARFAILLLFFSRMLSALPEDSSKPLNINANSSAFNYKTGYNIYDGNVKIDQGESHLTADRVTTQNNSHHKLEEAIAYGTTHLAHYWTLPDKDDIMLNAEAKVIKFFPIKSMVVLEGDVVVTQGENSFHGPIIIYNIKDQTVAAPASEKGHATIIIEPTKLES